MTTVILSNLAKTIDKATKIKSHIITCNQQKEILRSMNQKNGVMDKVVEGFEEYGKTLLQECTDELKSEIGELKDGHEEEQVRKTLYALGNLMTKGMEVYASIDSPTEIKELLPISDEIKIISRIN